MVILGLVPAGLDTDSHTVCVLNIKAAQWTGRLWFCLSLIKHNKEVKGVDVSDGGLVVKP